MNLLCIIFRLGLPVSAVLAFCSPLCVQATDRPLIRTNLRWSKPASADLGHPSILKFVTSNKLAIAGPPEDLSEGASLKQGHVEILDVQTGAVTQKIPWSAPSSTTNFALIAALPLSDGQFVFQSWNQLTLFSADGKIVATRTLPVESKQADYDPNLTLWDRWRLLSSPNGKDLLAIRHSVNSRENEEHWLSIETLEDLQLRTSSGPDNMMAVGREQELCRAAVPKKEPIAIRAKNGESHALCSKCYGSAGLFLNENQIVVSSWPRARFLVVSTDGQIQVDQTIGKKDDRILQMSVAPPQSHQIAFVLGPQYLRKKAGKISVLIYDTARKKAELVMQITERIQIQTVGGFEIESRTGPQIAFSPDLRSLAVLDDSTLQMYALTP
jgi:hypothetical protein